MATVKVIELLAALRAAIELYGLAYRAWRAGNDVSHAELDRVFAQADEADANWQDALHNSDREMPRDGEVHDGGLL